MMEIHARGTMRRIGAAGLVFVLVAGCGSRPDPADPAPPTDCRNALQRNPNAPSGPTVIQPAGRVSSIDVYCDQATDGGGWILTYKVRSNIDRNDNPWWDQVMPGSGTSFPVSVDPPVASTEGPTMATRAGLTAATGATEWRATVFRGGQVVFDLVSSYAGTGGQGLRCFASGTCDAGQSSVPAPSVGQTCSTAATDGRVLVNMLGGPIAAGGTGFVCDVGWTTCDFCVDFSEVRTDDVAGGTPANAVYYVGDSYIALTDTTTLYWIR